VGSPTRVVRMSTSSSFWRVSDARQEHVKMLEDQLQVLAAFPRLFLLSYQFSNLFIMTHAGYHLLLFVTVL
jgi:hypothetical protein